MPKIRQMRASIAVMRDTLRDWKWSRNHTMPRDTVDYHAIMQFRDWLESEMRNHHLSPLRSDHGESECEVYTAFLGSFYSTIGEIFAAFEPTVSIDNGADMIALWSNAETRAIGIAKRVKGKPGKMIRKMFPDIPDAILEKIVDSYRKKFSGAGLKLKSGESADDFKHAYSHIRADMQNPSTSADRKSLANSCMRHDFDNLPNHPSEAYASGDFRILWVEDSAGRIAARCVVSIAKGGVAKDIPKSGPVYGNSEASMDMIESALAKIGAKSANDGDWNGSRLDAINYRGGYIAPYLDVSPKFLEDCGSYLRITRNGGIDASDYSGLLPGGNRCQCYECGENIDEDESYSDDNGNSYCDECYGNLFSHCEHCDSTVEQCDTSTVYSLNRYGRAVEMCWCDDCCDRSAIHCVGVGQYWQEDHTYRAADGGYISALQYNNGDYFMSGWDGEIYPDSDRVEIDTGESVARHEIEGDHDWQLMPDGKWSKLQEEMNLEMESAE